MTTQNTNLAQRAGDILQAQGLTISAAESCTGGLLMSTLTDVPGSSAYVLGGAITYSNAIKERVVGVKHTTLMSHGAVSEAVAREMADGARSVFGSDVGVGITGIAGPGGGTEDKPVGLVYIGLAIGNTVTVREFVWQEDRAGNKARSVEAALQMIIDLG